MSETNRIIELTPEQLRRIARYEMTFRDVTPEDAPETVEFHATSPYRFSVDDLLVALRGIRAADPTIQEFGNNWLYHILQMDESFELARACGEIEDEDDTPEDLKGYAGLSVSDSANFSYIWYELEEAWEYNEPDERLSDWVDLDDDIETLEHYLANRGKPIEDWTFTEQEMEDYISLFDNDHRVAHAAEQELALCRKFVEELIPRDDVMALRIKGYGCYGGNALYDCDWYASRDCMERLYDLTDDPCYADTLGYIYYYGRCNGGVPEYEKAFHYYEIAAANGLFEGLYKLADLYVHGYACKQSPRTAYALYSMVYSDSLQQYLSSKRTEGNLPDAALRMGNVYAQGIHVKADPPAAYYYYLQADYLARQRAEHTSYYGCTTVVANAREALETAKRALPAGYLKEYTDQDKPLLFEYLIMDRYRCTMRRIRRDDGEWLLTAERRADRSGITPPGILLTLPQLSICEYANKVTMSTVRAEEIWFAADADQIRYDDIDWNPDEERWEFYNDEELTAWIRCKSFRIYGRQAAQPYGQEYHLASIRFQESGRTYDYICDLEDVQVGDTVIVNGYDGETEVEVVEMRAVRESELALPVERYKKVVRKA